MVDATGTLGFRTAKNVANGQYLNGYQIVPLPPVILAPPASAVVPPGAPQNLTVQAVPGSTTSGSLAYLWRKDGIALTDGSNLSGTSADTLRFTSFGPGDSGFYSVTVTDSNGSTHSDPVYVGLGELNSIIRFPPANSTGVNRDTPLRVSFAGGRAAVGSSGRTRVFRASDHALVESIDLTATAIHGVAGVTVEVVPLTTESEQITVRFPPLPNRRFARLRVTSPT